MDNLKKALQQYEIAKHLMTVTYPLIKDPKLLPTINANLKNAVDHALMTLPKPTPIDTNVLPILQKYNIPSEFSQLITELNEIKKLQQKSPVEFSRKDNYILASREFKLKAVSPQETKKNLLLTKQFLDWVSHEKFAESVSSQLKGKA